MSNEIKKARLRELAAQAQIEICLQCYRATEDCNCQPVTMGALVSMQEYRRCKEGLGAVRP